MSAGLAVMVLLDAICQVMGQGQGVIGTPMRVRACWAFMMPRRRINASNVRRTHAM